MPRPEKAKGNTEEKMKLANGKKLSEARKDTVIRCSSTSRDVATGVMAQCGLPEGHIGDHLYSHEQGFTTSGTSPDGVNYTFSFHWNGGP